MILLRWPARHDFALLIGGARGDSHINSLVAGQISVKTVRLRTKFVDRYISV
jgi:hypothetical protein